MGILTHQRQLGPDQQNESLLEFWGT